MGRFALPVLHRFPALHLPVSTLLVGVGFVVAAWVGPGPTPAPRMADGDPGSVYHRTDAPVHDGLHPAAPRGTATAPEAHATPNPGPQGPLPRSTRGGPASGVGAFACPGAVARGTPASPGAAAHSGPDALTRCGRDAAPALAPPPTPF